MTNQHKQIIIDNAIKFNLRKQMDCSQCQQIIRLKQSVDMWKNVSKNLLIENTELKKQIG